MPTTPHVPGPASLSLIAQLELASAARAVGRAAARTRPAGQTLELVDRRTALRARKAFREAVAILQAEMVR